MTSWSSSDRVNAIHPPKPSAVGSNARTSAGTGTGRAPANPSIGSTSGDANGYRTPRSVTRKIGPASAPGADGAVASTPRPGGSLTSFANPEAVAAIGAPRGCAALTTTSPPGTDDAHTAAGAPTGAGLYGHSHNIVLQLLAETGLVGAFVIVGAVLIWLAGLRLRREAAGETTFELDRIDLLPH